MKLITILGPTAVGKTRLAVELAHQIDGEVISADSRQVYRGMDIGTGKDLKDYEVEDNLISYHLIDILDAGEEYNVYEFQKDFYAAYEQIIAANKPPILCGGTGMYLQAALAEKQLLEVPIDEEQRKMLEELSDSQLNKMLIDLQPNQHNSTDLTDRKRTIRAIEIERFNKQHKPENSPINGQVVFGLMMDREKLRARIKERLEIRLEEGMIEEVQSLIDRGITYDQLDFYGLEYRYISKYIKGDISYEEMFTTLLQAIRRFAKKQMTWYRRMEKLGTSIHWLDATKSSEEKLSFIIERISLNS